jgi:hypothetical protein
MKMVSKPGSDRRGSARGRLSAFSENVDTGAIASGWGPENCGSNQGKEAKEN